MPTTDSALRVFKFGGASIRDASGIENLGEIVRRFGSSRQLIVVSAAGKTTNALERFLEFRLGQKTQEAALVFEEIIESHRRIALELDEKLERRGKKPESNKSVFVHFEAVADRVRSICFQPSSKAYAVEYDRIIGCGELLSNALVAAYLEGELGGVSLLDAYALFRTDSNHRQARIDWESTRRLLSEACALKGIYVLPGFIGADAQACPTTLGREGSDYSASAAAFVLGADSVTIWKDVPGFMSGDPKVFPDVRPIRRMSYEEAIELAYYGASVIHPKAIQPVKKAGIPLLVKSFLDAEAEGSRIDAKPGMEPQTVCFIRSDRQSLIQLSTRELSFVAEDHLVRIYGCFHRHGIRVNLSQLSATRASFCFQSDPRIEAALLAELSESFDVEHRTGLSLFTALHHTPEAISYLRSRGQVIIEQSFPSGFRVVVDEDTRAS